MDKEISEKYKKDYDAVLLMYSTLKRLNGGCVNTFEQRLRSQKMQYLAQVFAISPAYKFNLYLRGPYSPDLAHDLFELQNAKINIKKEEFTPKELEERFIKARNFIEDKTTRQLELISTSHWLSTIAKLTKEKIVQKLKKWKEASDSEIIETFNFIEKL